VLKKIISKNFILIIILLIGAFFRFYRIDGYMEFLGDQGRDVSIIRNFLQNGDLFFIGPQTSIGNMYLGPYFYYLIAPALFLANYNPVGPAIFIGLISLATIFLIYFVGQRWFNRNTGLIAAFLFAISPVVIKYSNFIWNPNIMPFFALLFIFFFFEAIRLHYYRFFVYASLAFIMVINSHYLGLALLPIVGLYWIFYLIKFIKTKSKYLKPFLINTLFAVVIFIISLTPQILFDIKHQGQNIKALLSFFTYRETTINIKPYKAIPELPTIFNQINTSLLSAKNETFGLIISILFIIGLVFYFFKKQSKENFTFLATTGWYFFGLVSLALYKQHIYDHYFGFLFPVVFLLIALLINRFKIIGLPVLALITILSLMQNPFIKTPNYQVVHSKNIAMAIDNNVSEKDGDFNIVFLASYNDFRAQAARYFLNNKNIHLLNPEKYQEAQTLFVVIDDPVKWKDGIDSDIWEIKTFGSKNIIDQFTSSDNTKIIKLSKNNEIKK
jgi:4-amino-4-deoxy-L-arabinose transferase-like glycosyltransferase